MSFMFGVLTLVLGFSISGAAASCFEALTDRRASFRLLREPDVTAVAAVPVVTIGASYILARNLYRGGVGRQRSATGVLVGVVLSGVWSLVIGAAALSTFVR